MILKGERLAELLIESEQQNIADPLIIVPQPHLENLRKSGSASIDLRLGTWFVTPRHSRMSHIDITNERTSQSQFTKTTYVPFGEEYYLHPKSFVLGVTLEWLCLPKNLAGYLIGKSSWGRCGLIIATATGVHPGFKGCLTLELANHGEVPIPIKPGILICQLFLHKVETLDTEYIDQSSFVGLRKPIMGRVKLDEIAKKLSKHRSR
jgi:dCTP deaminase